MTSAKELVGLCRDALREAGEPEAEVFACSRERGFARFAIGELGQHMQLVEPRAVVRVAHGKRVAESATARLDALAVAGALREAARAARMVPETEGFTRFADASEPGGDDPPRYARATAEASAERRVELLSPSLDAIAKAGLISAGALETTTSAVAVATTGGLSRCHEATQATFQVWALETPGAGGAAGYGCHTHRDVGALDLAGQTERAIRLCRMGKNPGALDAGVYDVVLEPPAVAELVEWLATIAFGAPEVEQGTSPLGGRFGERITGEAVTLLEDPLDATELGLGAPFDREGVWRGRVPLIERGVARGVLYDRIHAARARVRSTGSALVPDLASPASVGACAVHMAPGEAASVEELIQGVTRGLYICRLHYVNGYLETRRAVMTGLTRDGCFLIEHGRIARPVGNLRFTDSFLEALARADGMTRARALVPTRWSNAGAMVVPAVRMRAVRFNGRSQQPIALDSMG